MKRSEFISKLNDKEDPWVTSVVGLAEAAGVVWDPEDGPLPKRIFCEPCGPFLWPEGETSVEPAYRERYYTEAARCYNAWPELWAAFDVWTGRPCGYPGDADFSDELSRILGRRRA